jgi:mRNA interferase MazF
VWLDFDPQAGREQMGRRPAFVLTPRSYNERSGLCLACPMTNQVKGYPFEVAMPERAKVGGVILVDHVKSVSWEARRAELIGNYPQVAEDVLAKLDALLQR